MATGDDVLRVARAQIGKPYVFGAVGPNAFDCSGLVVYCFNKAANKPLPHFTGALINYGSSVAKADLAIGDLVFPDPGHVQIYSGGGRVVEAPHTGAKVREVKMWGFWKARRVIAPGSGSGGGVTVPVGNPLVPDAIENAAHQLNDAVAWLTDPHTWLRIAMFLVGFFLALVGVFKLDNVKKAASAVASGVAHA
jgi:hypothetical protein